MERVGLGDPRFERGIEQAEWSGPTGGRPGGGAEAEAQPKGLARTRCNDQPVMAGRLRTAGLRVRGGGLAINDGPMEGILDVRSGVGQAPQPLGIRLVLREQELAPAIDVEPDLSQARVVADDARLIHGRYRGSRLEAR